MTQFSLPQIREWLWHRDCRQPIGCRLPFTSLDTIARLDDFRQRQTGERK